MDQGHLGDADDANLDEIFAYMDQIGGVLEETPKVENSNDGGLSDAMKYMSTDDIIAVNGDMSDLNAQTPDFVPGVGHTRPTPPPPPEVPQPPPQQARSSGGSGSDVTVEAVAQCIGAEIRRIMSDNGGKIDLSFKGRLELFPQLEEAACKRFGDVYWKKHLGMQLRPFVAETLRELEKTGKVVVAPPAAAPRQPPAAPSAAALNTAAPAFTPSANNSSASRSAPSQRPIPAGNDGTQIFVRNLNPSSDERMLNDFFSQFGAVSGVKIMKHFDPPHRSRGMANITFAQPTDAKKALEKSSYYIDDRSISV
uniref:RRM domain-containing protein n=1 Tax=Octactis speculum TaxID=3111310 RepID=A0A7S2GJX2_9STRA|mmetsp:Transcript_50690/g.68976  ORF Transcript_50690/g.68976 Transcript_50690/m.68976 type:complete len:310 (+) Transcript_50690:59-988(+)